METRCVTQKDACNTSTCQAPGEASRSRGSRNEWHQRSKQQANKTRRRRGLKVMNYFMCPVSECGISMEITMRILYFLHQFCIQIHFVHNYESRCRSRFGCTFRIPTKFIWLLGEVGRGRGLLDGEPLGDDIGATTTLHAAPRPTPHAVAAGPTPHLVAVRGTHRSGLVAGLEACSFCGPRYPGRGRSD